MDYTRSQALDPMQVEAIHTRQRITNMRLRQVNGQRQYGGPPEGWDGPTPGAHCEVYISKIPRDTFENLLIPLFSSVGPLWEFRLMMNFSGENRGFAYAKYGSPAVAAKAIRSLNGYILKLGCSLCVQLSTEKSELCIEGLPAVTEQEQMLKMLGELVEGVKKVSLKKGPGIAGTSAIVGFSSHHAACMANKVLVQEFKKSFALSISTKWLSSGKPSLDEPLPTQRHFKRLLRPPTKPPRLMARQQPSFLPSHNLHTPSSPPFCPIVGGPAASQLQISPPHGFPSLPPPPPGFSSLPPP